jgi:uncharacterized protein involved in tolerance to divalent cations
MGTLKLMTGIFVIAASLYMCVELIPPYYSNYEFEDAIKTEALTSTYTPKSESEIQNTVYKFAQNYDIPLTKDGIKVQRSGSQNVGSVSIEAPYTVHLDIPLYPVDLHFDPSTQNKSPF